MTAKKKFNPNSREFRRRLERQRVLVAINQGRSLQGHTFESIATLNRKRGRRWHAGRAGLNEWTILEWAGAMAGEAGEAANAAKKLRRLEQRIRQRKGPGDRAAAVAKLAEEIADTFLYLDLMCEVAGIDFRAAIIKKFNETSEREGLPERL